jgi:hypothetical protein
MNMPLETWREYINERVSASAQIKYHYSISPGLIQVLLFIFLPYGRIGFRNMITTYTYDGEVKHINQSTYNRDKSRDKCMINNK